MRRFTAGLLALGMALGLCGCGAADPDTSRESIQVLAMDTVMLFTIYGERSVHAAYAAEDEVRRLESLLSRTDGDSAVSALNAGGGAEDSGELAALLEAAKDYSQAADGAFDITLAPVSTAWGFTTGNYRVPSREELDALLERTGMDRVHTGGESVRLDGGTEIDLGGIAKGYAADRIAALLREDGVPRATISLGGNVLAWGDRPGGTPWQVGVQDPAHPDDPGALACLLGLTDAFAVTSGGYQRYFEEGGRTYHHILDPATGAPAESGLLSVTVVADCPREADGTPGPGTMCDALSTALFVMGEERALDFWRSGAYDFELAMVTDDGRVVVTEGLRDALVETGDGYDCAIVS